MPSLMVRHSASVTALCFVLFIIPVCASSLFSTTISSSTRAEPTAQNIVFFLFTGLPSRTCTAAGLVFFYNTRIKKDADIDFSVWEAKQYGFSIHIQRCHHKCAAVFSSAEVTRSFIRLQPKTAQQLHCRWTPLLLRCSWTAVRRSDLF